MAALRGAALICVPKKNRRNGVVCDSGSATVTVLSDIDDGSTPTFLSDFTPIFVSFFYALID